MVCMTEERAAADFSTAVAVAREHLDSLMARTTDNLARMARPLSPEHNPVTADGASTPAAPVDVAALRRAALTTSHGLTGTQAVFTEEHTTFLADLGRDLRKSGVGTPHYEAVAEAAGRAVCDEFGYPYPGGAELTYRQAAELGIPDGLTELLHAVDDGIRIVALGAVEDDEAGVPASLPAEVVDVIHPTHAVTVVRLQARTRPPGWAGQALEVRTPASPTVWHQFASALPPNEHGFLEFHCPSSTVGVPEPGETWVVANPTGGLGIPQDWTGEVVMIALGAGLAALRALVLEVAERSDRPRIHLYWAVRTADELHEIDGLRGLDTGFPWFTFTPVVAAEGSCTAAETAVAEHPGRKVLTLVSGEDAASVAEQVRVLTEGGVDPTYIIAEP